MGRVVLVNSVLDCQLVYFLSSLQLPPSVIHQMDRRRRAFLWSGDQTGKSSPASCLVAWIQVCMPKELGGLGIKDMGTQNICLLLKLIHKLHCPQSSAWARWVQGRISICTLKGDIHGDHWEVLRSLLPLYQAITSVHLGDGRSCSFWLDVWHGDESLADIHPALYSHCTKKEASVSEMLQSGIQQALVPRLSTTAVQQLEAVEEVIAGTQPSLDPDRRISAFSKGSAGLDSRAIYHLLKARGQPNDERSNFVWRNSAPPRVQLFMWLLVQRRIQCRTVLQRKQVLHDTICEVCHEEDETPEHIISGCVLGKIFWQKLNMSSMLVTQTPNLHTLSPPGGVPNDEFAAFIALSCWQLWKARNAAIFRNETQTITQVFGACKTAAEQWRHRFPKKKKHIVDHWCQVFEMARQAQ